jgi:serine/threonine protein kinase
MTTGKLKKGTKLGDYEIIDLLGSGGMASVYKGYDASLDREVAIKIIHPDEELPDFVERFQREARVVASLRHANIVQVYQFGEQDGVFYMVQELLPGPTLADVLRKYGRRRMATSRIIDIVTQLAAALDFAHSQGVTHRDVKPSNAMYNHHDELVLTDFGIARSEADAMRTATGPGIVMGTPGYVAPEQAASSASITPACDIYALGVVSFELLTGRLPFEADAPMEIVLKHLYESPPNPSSLRQDLPKSVDRVIQKALSKEPTDRYASAGSLAKALQNALSSNRSSKSKSSSSSSSSSSSNSSSNSSSSSSSRAKASEGKKRASAAKSATEPNTSRASAKTTDTKRNKKKESSDTPASSAAKRDDAQTDSATATPRTRIVVLRVLLLLVCVAGVAGLAMLEMQTHAVSQTWAVTVEWVMGMVEGGR